MKKGVSPLVIVVFIILIIVFLALIYLIFSPLIKFAGKPSVDLEIVQEGYTAWDPINRLAEIQVRRGKDKADIEGFDFIFVLDGNELIHPVRQEIGLSSLNIYYFNFSEIEGKLQFVKLKPVYRGGEKGNILSTLKISSFEIKDLSSIEKNFIKPGESSQNWINSNPENEPENEEDEIDCSPKTCSEYYSGDVCGASLSDGCGKLMNCTSCGENKFCDVSLEKCKLNNVSCEAETLNATCGERKCGRKQNNCGEYVTCGTCASGLSCNSQGSCEARVIKLANNITQYNITWYFDKDYEYGQFVNGDYWVAGPVKITKIEPAPDCSSGRHGTMINPRYGKPQGYDSRAPYYNVSLCHSPQFTANPGDTLISSISLPAIENKKYLKVASVLTITDKYVPSDSFRPPYTRPSRVQSTDSDNLLFSYEDTHLELLPRLSKTSDTPNITSSAKLLQKVALEHGSTYQSKGGGINPTSNPYLYGRDLSSYVSEMSLQLMLNYSDQEKKQTLVNLMQYGIDLYGVYLDGGYWGEDGGIFCGRKWPILFSGIMLGNEDMKNIERGFHEDQQTFHVSEEDIYEPPYALKIFKGWIVGNAKVTSSSSIVEGIGTAWKSTGMIPGANIMGTDGKNYTCIKKHIAAESNRPVTGADWQQYWVYNQNAKTAGKWELNESYKIGWFGVDNDSEAFNPEGKAYVISRIIDDTHLELASVYKGSTNNNAPFKIGVNFLYYGHSNPGKFRDYVEYLPSDLGLPEWGIRATSIPESSGKDWDATYRECCNANAWAGFLLLAQAMEEKAGAKSLWNDKAIFDYQDRYMDIETQVSPDSWMHSWRGKFPITMWNKYRKDYGCVWTRDNPSDVYSNGHFICDGTNIRCSWQATNVGQLITSCNSYPNQRAKDYDPCNVC